MTNITEFANKIPDSKSALLRCLTVMEEEEEKPKRAGKAPFEGVLSEECLKAVMHAGMLAYFIREDLESWLHDELKKHRQESRH
jgi:hypothetical protein